MSLAKRTRIKDVLLGKLQISKTSEMFEKNSEEGRRVLKNSDLNKFAFTEFILPIDFSNCCGKIAFGILKGC